ncbi:MAG: tetratricopeptide repeat protein [Candidatus Heimdallarchaeota archaeon]|nr:MAG: tetratricopeptide repeat protein [Candidatus Heimdallarchaeota archaeon]
MAEKKRNRKKSIDWFNEGKSFEILGKYQDAIKAYNQAINLQKDFYEAWDRKGWNLENLKEYEKALECYETALRMKPNFKLALDNKSRVEKKIIPEAEFQAIQDLVQRFLHTQLVDFREMYLSDLHIQLHRFEDYFKNRYSDGVVTNVDDSFNKYSLLITDTQQLFRQKVEENFPTFLHDIDQNILPLQKKLKERIWELCLQFVHSIEQELKVFDSSPFWTPRSLDPFSELIKERINKLIKAYNDSE